MGFGVPLFKALAEITSSTALADYWIYAGYLGIRGESPKGWVDGSDAMNQKIMGVLSQFLPNDDFIVLDLKITVPPKGEPQSECRVNGQVSNKVTQELLKLDWPRNSAAYMFKQAFVLKRKPPQAPH